VNRDSSSLREWTDGGNEKPIQRRLGRFAFDNFAAMTLLISHD